MAPSTPFGTLLRRYRQAAGLSQEALAERAGLSARAISNLERGVNRVPRFDTLALLAGALSLSEPQQRVLQAAARPEAAGPAEAHPPSAGRGWPRAPTALIGRQAERADALARLRPGEVRLLTLTGPSGVGKTRLALELIQDLAPQFADGVLYVPLAPVRDAALVPAALAEAFGLHEDTHLTLEAQLGQVLQDKQLLLVLDNVEQVVDCAPFVADLLARCPQLCVLATSRRLLGVRAEQALTLYPLPLADAVALFRERAHAIRAGEAYGADEVARLCEQLDRLPLAIELAATQLRVLSLADLHQRLSQRLALLRGGPRDLAAHQQTMEDAIGWSYELLTAHQQRAFRALSVFTGGWTLPAADAVCAGEYGPGSEATVLALAALVDASLIQAEPAAGDTARFGMLSLLQAYALERLRTAGEEAHCRRRHAAYYAQLAQTVQSHFGPEPGVRPLGFSRTLAQELSNARAALEWAEAQGEAELGLRLVGFARLWHVRGQMSEAERWYERMLALDRRARAQHKPAAPLVFRIKALNGLGRTLTQRGQVDERAEGCVREAVALAESLGDPATLSNVLATRGMIAQAKGAYAEAQAAFAVSLAYARAGGQTGLIARALMHGADVASLQGDPVSATHFSEEALQAARSAGMTWDVALLTTRLGHLARQRQDLARAQAHYREALGLYRTLASPGYLAGCLAGYAATLCVDGRFALAARLCAAAVGLREQAQIQPRAAEAAVVEQVVTSAQAALGAAAFEREWQMGSALTQEAAISEAMGE